MRVESCTVAIVYAMCCAFYACGAVSCMRSMILEHTARSDIYDPRPEHDCPHGNGLLVLSALIWQLAE